MFIRIFVLLASLSVLQGCSGDSAVNLAVEASGDSNLQLRVPPTLLQSRMIDRETLFAEVSVSYRDIVNSVIAERDPVTDTWSARLTVPVSEVFSITITWFDRVIPRRLDLVTSTRSFEAIDSPGNLSFTSEFDDFDSDQFDADADSIVNLTERLEGTDPFSTVQDDDIDSDNDGISDAAEIELGLDPTNADTDSDGVADGIDPFPNDPNESLDSDGDGVSDGRDQFPDDPDESTDLNGDGLGDNANPFSGVVISGSVINNATSAPVPGAQVSLDLVTSGTTNPVVRATVDRQGEFAIVYPSDMVPDSFVIVVSADGFQPTARILANTGNEIDASDTELAPRSGDFVILEKSPSVHHLGDNNFSGIQNSQFQRNAEGTELTRNFNLSSLQTNASAIDLLIVAKGIDLDNPILVNGTNVGVMPSTPVNGAFGRFSVSLPVQGLLNSGANTFTIQSDLNFTSDFDDYEFVLIGLIVN